MSINEKVTDGIDVSGWSDAEMGDAGCGMNQQLIDRIREVSEWSTAGGVGDTGLGMIALARELRDMLDAEPADSPEPVAGKQHSQRDVLVINATVAINSALALLIGAGYDVSDAMASVRRMLDEFDASREGKP